MMFLHNYLLMKKCKKLNLKELFKNKNAKQKTRILQH